MATPMLLTSGKGAVGGGTSATSAAAVTVAVGFKPKYVRIVAPAANKAGKVTEWFDGMTAAHAIEHKDDTGYSCAAITSNGITVSDRGFTIGTSCQVNSGKYYWLALG